MALTVPGLSAKVDLDDTALAAAAERIDKKLQGLIKTFGQFEKSAGGLFVPTGKGAGGLGGGASSLKAITKEANSANLALVDFGRIVQDAPFGLIGVQNNLEPMLLSFGRMSAAAKEAGVSVKSVLLKSLAGPGGLIFAVSALSSLALVLGPRLKGAFGDAKLDVKEFTEAVGNAVSKMLDLGEVGKFTGTLAQAEGAVRRATDSLKEIRDSLSGPQGIVIEIEQNAGASGEFTLGQQRRLDAARARLVKLRMDEAAVLGSIDGLEQSVLSALTEQASAIFLAKEGFAAIEKSVRNIGGKGIRETVQELQGMAVALTGMSPNVREFLLAVGKEMPAALSDAVKMLEEGRRATEDFFRAMSQGTVGNLRKNIPRPGALDSAIRLAPETLEAIQLVQGTLNSVALNIADVAVVTFDFLTLTASLEDVWESFGNAVSNIMRNVIADITAAIAKALILKALVGLVGGGGGIVGSIIRTVAGSPARVVSAPAVPVTVNLSGNLSMSTDRVRFSLRQSRRLSNK